MPHSTQYRSFRRRSSQPITWLILTNKTLQENTDKQTEYKSEKVNNLKYYKTKLLWFSCLLEHSARKQGGLILQCSRAHTGWRTLIHWKVKSTSRAIRLPNAFVGKIVWCPLIHPFPLKLLRWLLTLIFCMHMQKHMHIHWGIKVKIKV